MPNLRNYITENILLLRFRKSFISKSCFMWIFTVYSKILAKQHATLNNTRFLLSFNEGTSGVTLSQAAPSFPRNRGIAPLSRSQQQSHLLLPHVYEETGDDGIVPSTPTLYVPRRTDGFGEAVSSPHVPSGRFTFNESAAAQAVGQSEGDDSRGDLAQLDDSGNATQNSI